jgi:serine/threonine protein kinase
VLSWFKGFSNCLRNPLPFLIISSKKSNERAGWTFSPCPQDFQSLLAMEVPVIQGYRIRAQIGSGVSGVVYEAQTDAGELCAIKVFDSMASNMALLGERIRRVTVGRAQGATVEITAQALDTRPGCLVMPLLGTPGEGGDGSWLPRNLQLHFESFLRNDATWPFLLNLAAGLAEIHLARVAHGNLKPGNIFLDADGGPLLTDYATGFMPGVHRIGYSDALLYAPPEQLRNAEGYYDEAGYRWDVYAFGVLAYRLLTGLFPRLNDVFQSVNPAPGTQERFDIEADHQGIVAGLEQQRSIQWPDEPGDDAEVRRRDIVTSCLNLDPQLRPFNMREVSRRFAAIETELAAVAENQRLISRREAAERKRRSAQRRFATASLLATGLAAGWGGTQLLRMQEASVAEGDFEGYRVTTETTITDLEWQRDEARSAEAQAFTERDATRETLGNEQSEARAELQSAQKTNERLFDWILEKGVAELPTLEGRKARLIVLLEDVDTQLAGMSTRPALADQAALLKLRRVELVLAMGRLNEGEVGLEKVIADGKLPEKLMARARLRLLLLASKGLASELAPRLEKSEELILKAWKDDERKLIGAKAALALVKARMWEADGDGVKALASYLKSLKNYRELGERYPANMAVGLMMGRQYLSAALAAEGEGSTENAARLREEAAAAFTTLAGKQEKPTPEIQYQIAAAKAAQAISLWQQGDTFGSEELARESVTKLIVLARKMPNDFRVTMDLASQKGIVATALRDEGKPTEARVLLTQGISTLTEGLKGQSENWSAQYLLASLKWQLSGLMGQQGDGDAELKVGAEAHDQLQALLASKMKRPNPSEVRKSLAYLCGDLGHSADLRNERETAVAYLRECRGYWQELARDEGDQLEIREGYQWAVNRLSEMGEK